MAPIKVLQQEIITLQQDLDFIPETNIRNLAERAEAILKHCMPNTAPTRINQLTSFIIDHADVIFAILFTNKPSLIEQFFDNELSKEVLPVSCYYDKKEDRMVVKSSRENVCTTRIQSTFSQPPWDPKDISIFCDDQWKYMSPIFVQGQQKLSKREFEPSRILPWMPLNYVPMLSKGGYADVQQKSVHVAHVRPAPGQVLSLDDRGNYLVALKTLKGTDTKGNAAKEVAALDMIQHRIRSPHVIRAIAYYKKGHRHSTLVDHCLIFPWADGGNLWRFWMETNPKPKDVYLVWAFDQLCGIMEAVAEMHGLDGESLRHGDLKPENIVCFPDDSIANVRLRLVITDVGLAKAHDKTTDQRKKERVVTSTTVSTVRYQAPELESRPNEIHVLPRDFDVWSAGCICMEFAFWLIYGREELEEFTNDTKDESFWQSTGRQGLESVKLNDKIDQKLGEMIKTESSHEGLAGDALRQLILLIKGNLLVVHVRSLHEGQSNQSPSPEPLMVRRSSYQRFKGLLLRRKDLNGGGGRSRENLAPRRRSRIIYRSSSAEAANELKRIRDGLVAGMQRATSKA